MSETRSITTRCLAHIINLATQALIATRSKAKYYDPHASDDLEDDVVDEGPERDEAGLVRKICVKVLVTISLLHSLLHDFIQARSSSQRKDVFKRIQEDKNIVPAVQLLLDMKVRWGSTYVMLDRAELRREVSILLLNTVILQLILLSGG